jgi:hypothetical protein
MKIFRSIFLCCAGKGTIVRQHYGVWLSILAFGFLASSTAGLAQVAGRNVTGTWKFFVGPRPPDGRLGTLQLKQDGDKLTGKVTLPGGMSTEIQDGKVTEKGISFFIQPRPNALRIYHVGEVAGDTIKGKTEYEAPGGARRPHFDWEAHRAAD